jgi:hypothetical protein
MVSLKLKTCIEIVSLACLLGLAHGRAEQKPPRSVLLEVIRNSWGVERDETLVYLRVYSDGLAEAHPMKKVDFRHIEFMKKQLSGDQVSKLRSLLADPATVRLLPEYSRYWGNKDFGFRYEITLSGSSKKQVIELLNFQPFLARKRGEPYPKQVERLGCSVWKLRAEVSGESLEKDWLRGCTGLGY